MGSGSVLILFKFIYIMLGTFFFFLLSNGEEEMKITARDFDWHPPYYTVVEEYVNSISN